MWCLHNIVALSLCCIAYAALSGDAELKAGVFSDLTENNESCALLQSSGEKIAQRRATAADVNGGHQLLAKNITPWSASFDNKAIRWISISAVVAVLLAIAVKSLPGSKGSGASLPHAFFIYFADNVLVMFMATTAGTLGTSLFTSYNLDRWVRQILGTCCNGVLAMAMYAFAANRYRAHEKAEGATEAGGGEGAALYDVTSKSSYAHMMQMLPWMVIVPLVNIPIVISDNIHSAYSTDDHYGHKFIMHFVTFCGFLVLCILSALYYESRPDFAAPCAGMFTFLVNCVNHGLLSCAGKALHLMEDVILKALVGPENQSKFAQTLADVLILTSLTWFLLAHTWPKLDATTKLAKTKKNILTTITVYSWAFATVNDVWNWLYGDLYASGGFDIYWGVLALALVSAIVLAYFSDNNFYGGPSHHGGAFGLMLCWYVDFGAWWAWAQVMTDIDGRDHTFGGLLLKNFAVLIVLIAVTMFVYSYADLATMSKSREQRHQHVQAVKAEK